ncbi:MAG: hypothetical protein HY294_10025 [Candidatus Rokubacteria bacterium]|nr:hypothetical protein [Candidatus Rokubacteria bacterium]
MLNAELPWRYRVRTQGLPVPRFFQWLMNELTFNCVENQCPFPGGQDAEVTLH